MQDSYIGSTSASQAEEAGSITSILPPQDGRDAQHRSFWHSQKKMRRGTEQAQLAEYSPLSEQDPPTGHIGLPAGFYDVVSLTVTAAQTGLLFLSSRKRRIFALLMFSFKSPALASVCTSSIRPLAS